MAGNILTIKFNDEQQEQIKTATARSIPELNIDPGAIAELSEKDLEKVAGGFFKQAGNHNETLVRDRR